jgi:streptogramin lyase
VGGALAPNGNIYAAPYNNTAILKIDTVVGIASTISTSLSVASGNYRGIICAKNGKLYTIPSGQVVPTQKVLEFDPQNNSHRFFTDSPEGNWFGGVLASNGKIYGIPYTTSPILEINPTTGTATTSTISNTRSGYVGGVLGPNGKIYCIPFTATTVLEIDPNVGTASTFGTLSAGTKWAGGVLANNGKIYAIPYATTSVLEIDPIARTVSTFGESSDIWSIINPGWSDAALGSDGKIYAFPTNSSAFTYAVLQIDPDNRTLSIMYSQIFDDSNSDYFIGAVASRNGKIYGIPGISSSVVAIGVSAANKSPQWITKPHEVSSRCGFVTSLGNVGIATTTNQYFSGCLGVDGKIYAIPFDSNYVLKIDPNKETISLESYIPDFPGYSGPSFSSSIALKDGRICGIPYYSDKVIFYDPQTQQYTESNQINGQWVGGSLAPNGKIYCPGIRTRRTLVIDPVAGTASTSVFSPIGTADDPLANPSNWAGGVLAPNGKIYGVPFGATNVLEIDPVAGIQTTFGSLSSDNYKWYGGVLAPNGKIYCTPSASTSILKIDPVARTATTFGNTLSVISSAEYIYGSVLGADGKIYYPLYNSNKIVRLDPDTETLSIYHTLGEYASFGAGVLASNGNIYTIPAGVGISTIRAKVVSIGTTQKYEPANWMLSSYTNKSI